MDQVTIKINTTNAAFEDEFELARILRQIADNAESGNLREKSILDINGNKVGKIEVD